MDKIYKEKSAAVMRKGNKINMEEFLGELDTLYLADLDATISSYRTYDEVSAETYNDYKVACANIEMLWRLGYLNANELNAMRQTVADMRIKRLEALEDEKDGLDI